MKETKLIKFERITAEPVGPLSRWVSDRGFDVYEGPDHDLACLGPVAFVDYGGDDAVVRVASRGRESWEQFETFLPYPSLAERDDLGPNYVDLIVDSVRRLTGDELREIRDLVVMHVPADIVRASGLAFLLGPMVVSN
jgi:hypothetical protein